MKKLLVLSASLLILTSCGGNDLPTKKEEIQYKIIRVDIPLNVIETNYNIRITKDGETGIVSSEDKRVEYMYLTSDIHNNVYFEIQSGILKVTINYGTEVVQYELKKGTHAIK